MASSPLEFAAGPLVWIDCEMTGLDYKTNKIMEIAVIITNGNLKPVDDGLSYIIHHDLETLTKMGEWCTKTHGESGLTAACLASKNTKDAVQDDILAYIKKWIPHPRTGLLAGNSIHADRVFLAEEMPAILDWLHYRLVDVSSVKELCRRWYPQCNIPKSLDTKHRAIDDIRGSIQELQWYRENIFLDPKLVSPKSLPFPSAEHGTVPK